MCPPKTVTKNENCFELVVKNLKSVSNPKAKTKRKNVSAENCYKIKMLFVIVCLKFKNCDHRSWF